MLLVLENEFLENNHPTRSEFKNKLDGSYFQWAEFANSIVSQLEEQQGQIGRKE